MNRHNDKELRSEKVRSLLGEMPASLLVWSTAVLLAMLAAAVAVAVFIPKEIKDIFREILPLI